MSALANLKAIAPPPGRLIFPGSPESWANLERQLGLELPPDYKELIAVYGAGHFANFFGVANPFYLAASGQNYVQWVTTTTGQMEETKLACHDEAVDLPTFPSEGGLLPWGYTDNGDTLCWLTWRDRRWPIVCIDDRYSRDYDVFELPLPDFIAAWLGNKIPKPRITPANFYPLPERVFVPYGVP